MIMSTIAKMEYRTHVPWGWIAIEYCNINFTGDNAKNYANKWHSIEFEKFHKNDCAQQALAEHKKEIEADLDDARNAYWANQKWYRLWRTKEDRELECKIDSLSEKYNEICEEIEKLEKESFYTASQLVDKAHSFLIEYGFKLLSHNTVGSECVNEIEMWTLE